jgi:hypothetical protein
LFPKLFKLLGYTEGVEVGVQKGKFTEKLCKDNPELHMNCIDPWLEYRNLDWEDHKSIVQNTHDIRYQETMERLSKYNTTIIRKKSLEAVEDFKDDSLDFVYIDGNHRFNYIMTDIIYWVPKVRKGGIIACHDYHDPQVGTAVDAFTKCHGVRPWYITQETQPTAYWVQER